MKLLIVTADKTTGFLGVKKRWIANYKLVNESGVCIDRNYVSSVGESETAAILDAQYKAEGYRWNKDPEAYEIVVNGNVNEYHNAI